MRGNKACVLALLLAVQVLWQGAVSAQQAKAPASSPEAILAYREAANYQNNGAFEVAAEEWQKFLKNHPSDSLAPKAQHYLGVCQLQLKQHQAAAATFAALLKKHSSFEFAEEAYFNLATSQYALAAAGKKEQYEQAASTFESLLRRFPDSKHREDALFYSGEALYAQGKKREAADVYQRLIGQSRQSKRRADTLYALGVAREELGEHAAAGKTYDLLLAEFPSSPLAGEVRLRKAETLLQAGDVAAAERLFAAAASAKEFDGVDHALSRQAYCLAKLEKFGNAAAIYARLVESYPRSPLSADATIAAGRCYYRANQMDLARKWLSAALKGGDEHATEAAHWLCRLLIKAGDANAAVELTKKHLPDASGPLATNLHLDLADALYEIPARRRDALSEYIRLVSKQPEHELAPQALYSAAFTALALKQYDEAVEHARKFIEAFPRSALEADVRYVAAESSMQLKDYPAAERWYRELIDRHREHPQAEMWLLRRGLVALLAKDYDAAVSLLTPVADRLKSVESRAEAQFLIGSSHFHAGRYEPARSAFVASLRAAPNWKQADETLLLLARSQVKLGELDEAETNLKRLLSQYSDSRHVDEARYRQAELLDARRDVERAGAAYLAVIKQHPNSQFTPYAYHGYAWTRFKARQFKEADEAFTALLKKHSGHDLEAQAQLGRAMARRQAGDARGAVADLDAYLKSNPDRSQTSEALYERGLALVSLQDFAAAVASFEDILKQNPGYSGADKVLYEVGWAYKSQDKADEAARAFARLAEKHPDSRLAAEAWFHVAENHYDGKQYAEAASAYGRAKRGQPGEELAEKGTYKLGWSYYQLKDYGKALRQFEEQLTAFPRGSLAGDAVFMRAECLFRQEKYAEARPAYDAALQSKASTPTIEALTLLHAGQTASQLKDWKGSIDVLSQLAKRQPDSPLVAEASYELGWARQNLGQTDAALADYETAATNSRDHVGARARFMRGELLFEQKKHPDASREFQRAMYGFGGEDATTETKNWQAKSGYEAGRCAEVQLNTARDAEGKKKLLADARRCYSFVAEKHADHELAAQAKKRLAALSKL